MNEWNVACEDGRHFGKFHMAISLERVVRPTLCLILGYRFSGTVNRMDLVPVVPNSRFGRPPSCKISNDHISGMSYPIHFHELQSSLEEYRRK